ncbi:hypothetical protein K439DRAFT_1641563 [Ramaria rubella]|nr:hypothetical protein K439DRAFT_1641563 [Ramaria rubella]
MSEDFNALMNRSRRTVAVNGELQHEAHRSLQLFLNCLSRIASASRAGGLDVINTNATVCGHINSSSPLVSSWNIPELCNRLITKKLLIVGSHTTYKLHDLLLDSLPSGSRGSQFRCHSAALCTWHEICSPFPPPLAEAAFSSERHRTPPRNLMNSAILRFALSSTLYTGTLDEMTVQPFVSPLTGVREHVALDWLDKAQRSDIVMITKEPVPAPAWSYMVSNWSDVDRGGRFTVRIPRPGSREWIRMQPFIDLVAISPGFPQGYGLVEAAWKATVVKWLPELVETLLYLWNDNTMTTRETLFVWLGSSFIEEGCACQIKIKHQESQTDEHWLLDLLQQLGCEDRCIFENAQVYIQKILLTRILDKIGIVYIPEATSLQSLSYRSESPIFHENGPSKSVNIFFQSLIAILRWHQDHVRRT